MSPVERPVWPARPVVGVALGVALVIALFAPHIDHQFVTDDAVYIAENPAVSAGAPLAAYFLDRATIASNPEFHWQAYRPLRTIAFRLVAVVGGLRPLSFGIANLILYALSTALLLVWLLRLGCGRAEASWATAIWAAAPVHVEPVLYASSLGDHLSLVLTLVALMLALDGLEVDRRGGSDDALTAPRRFRWIRSLAALGLAFAAMLTKEAAVVIPALLALAAATSGALRQRPRRVILVVLAHGFVALAFLALRTVVIGAFGHGKTTTLGALEALWNLPVRLGSYVFITIAPLGHRAAYVLPRLSPLALAGTWALLMATAVWVVRRAPRPVLFGAGWFVLSLLPVLGFVPLLAAMADRFALLASVGAAMCLPAAIGALGHRRRPLSWLAPGVVLALFAAGTTVESLAWTDDVALWGKTVALEPESSAAHRNLGIALLRRGEPERALLHFDRAWALGEQDARIAYRRAMTLEALQRLAEAEAAASFAATSDPRYGRARALYGALLAKRGAVKQAEVEWAAAREHEPHHPTTLLLEMELASARGDAPAELAAADELVALFPSEPRFRYRRATALLQAGDPRAADEARACLRLSGAQPQCACVLGRALVRAGRKTPEALQALETGLESLPPGPERQACEEARRQP